MKPKNASTDIEMNSKEQNHKTMDQSTSIIREIETRLNLLTLKVEKHSKVLNESREGIGVSELDFD